MGLGGTPTDGYFGLLALESRIMFDGSGIDLGEMAYDPNYPNQAAIPIVTKDIFPENQSAEYSDGDEIRFVLTGKKPPDRFYLESSNDLDKENAILVGDDKTKGKDNEGDNILDLNLRVYSDGKKEWLKIGEVVGQNTEDFSIRFLNRIVKNRIANHDFDEPITWADNPEAPKKDEWIRKGESVLPGMSKIEIDESGKSYTVPHPRTRLPESDPLYLPSDATPVEIWRYNNEKLKLGTPDPFVRGNGVKDNWNAEIRRYVFTDKNSNSFADPALYMESKSLSTSVGSGEEGTVFGPYVASSEFELLKGETFTFDYAQGTSDPGDAGNPFFYLLNTDNGKTLILDDLTPKDLATTRDSPGRDGNAVWKEWKVSIEETGRYRLISMVHAIDKSQAGQVGYSAIIDDLGVEAPITGLNVNDIVRLVKYEYENKGTPNNPVYPSKELDQNPRKVAVSGKIDGDEREFASGTLRLVEPETIRPFGDISKEVVDKGKDGSRLFENPDYHDFSEGELRITRGSDIRYPLSVANKGDGEGQIGLDGKTVTYEGKKIGVVDANENGEDGKPLRISFRENATPEAVEALIKSVIYVVPGKTTPAVDATIQKLTERDGASYNGITQDNQRTYEISKQRDKPFWHLSRDVHDPNDDSPLFEDPDHSPKFSKGKLRIDYAPSERREPHSDLSIENQGDGKDQIGFDGETVTYGGKKIGAVDANENGRDGKPLRIVLQDAPPRAVEALIKSVTYVAPFKVPVADVRAWLTDEDGESYDITQGNKLTKEILKKEIPPKIKRELALAPMPESKPTDAEKPTFGEPTFRSKQPTFDGGQTTSWPLLGARSNQRALWSADDHEPSNEPCASVQESWYDINGHVISFGSGMKEQVIGRAWFEFRIPFYRTDPKADVEFQATMEDGTKLPNWIELEPTTGILSGKVPDDWDKEVITLRIIARDVNQGDEAKVETTFDLRVAGDEGNADAPDKPDIGDKYHENRNAPASVGRGERSSLSAQLAGVGRSGFEVRRMAFVAMMSGDG
uniref:Dystroglycan-type cadherin-like domain-containing protein n=1 Tax=Candidatus Kentrum sp. TC TaxID=2126339 RepID=A0A451A4G8_9GAMM|nr:MAG: hypothetical protein BECKTC1821F_GA0114240_10513 [Candidatus Kentron sp. TC]